MRNRPKPCCIICYKPDVSNSNEVEDKEGLKRFFKLFERHLLDPDDDGTKEPFLRSPPLLENLINAGAAACRDCSKIMDSFSELYERMKTLELLVNGKVFLLKNRMSHAGKLPARIGTFRRYVQQLKNIGGGADGAVASGTENEALDSICNFNKDLVTKCIQKLRSMPPRLTLNKCEVPLPPPPEVKSELEVVDSIVIDLNVGATSFDMDTDEVAGYLDDPLQDSEQEDVDDDPVYSADLKNDDEEVQRPPKILACNRSRSRRGAILKPSRFRESTDPLENEACLVVPIPESLEEAAKPKSIVKSGKHKCLLCHKKFLYLSNFRMHYQKHHLIRYQCKLCHDDPKIFIRRIDYNQHYRRVHKGSPSKPTKPKKAPKIKRKRLPVPVLSSAEPQPQSSRTPETGTFQCTLCPKEFHHRGAYHRHHFQVHLKLKPFNCPECGKDFPEKSFLAGHKLKGKCKTVKSSPPPGPPTSEMPNNDDVAVSVLAPPPPKTRTILNKPRKNYSCRLCGKSFGSRRTALSAHRKSGRCTTKLLLPTPPKNVCPVCGRIFFKKMTLNQHLKRFHSPRSNLNMEKLEVELAEPELITVDDVDSSTKPEEEAYAFNPERNSYKCHHCYKPFRTLKNFQLHFQKYSKIRYKCRLCEDKVFVRRDLYDNHHQAVHIRGNVRLRRPKTKKKGQDKPVPPLERQKHKCDICGKEYTTLGNLRAHAKEIHFGGRSKVRDKLCNHCGKGFVALRHLNRHIKLVHSEFRERRLEDPDLEPEEVDPGQVQPEAGISTKPTTSEAGQEAEAGVEELEDDDDNPPYVLVPVPESESQEPKSVFNPKTRKHKCSACGKQYRCLDIFEDHFQNCRPARFRYQCSLCGRLFKFQQAFQRHYQSVHKKVRYPCPKCGKAYTLPNSLRNHQLSTDCWKGVLTLRHRGGKGQFKCDLCEKVFTRTANLKQHVTLYHKNNSGGSSAGGKEHLCNECGRGFAEYNNLWNHLHSTHNTGPEQQKCDICGKGFRLTCHLANHRKRTHGLALGEKKNDMD